MNVAEPLKPEEQPSRRKRDQESARLRILAVDDDPSYLRYLKLVLGRGGFEVVTADNGSDALQRLQQDGEIAILLVDLAMPEMTGLEIVQRIHAESHTPGLYMILLTAQEGTETKLRALNSGCDDYLTKTSDESEILAKLRSAARRVEMERRLHLQNEELQSLALTDELTGVANRRALFRQGEEILRSGRRLSVVLFDLDRFKQVNDTYGHLTGDRILADVAKTFKEQTRYGDVIARYGGDEFVLLLPDTGVAEAQQLAERLADRIRQLTWTVRDTPIHITASLGIADSLDQVVTLSELLTRSDEQLYRGKRSRRTAAVEQVGG